MFGCNKWLVVILESRPAAAILRCGIAPISKARHTQTSQQVHTTILPPLQGMPTPLPPSKPRRCIMPIQTPTPPLLNQPIRSSKACGRHPLMHPAHLPTGSPPIMSSCCTSVTTAPPTANPSAPQNHVASPASPTLPPANLNYVQFLHQRGCTTHPNANPSTPQNHAAPPGNAPSHQRTSIMSSSCASVAIAVGKDCTPAPTCALQRLRPGSS